jgi:hypothetical protein
MKEPKALLEYSEICILNFALERLIACLRFGTAEEVAIEIGFWDKVLKDYYAPDTDTAKRVGFLAALLWGIGWNALDKCGYDTSPWINTQVIKIP